MTVTARVHLDTHELIVDSFAGGGGASCGIEWATGRSPDIAINHDREAIALHRANHPKTRHYSEDVWTVDPIAACAGRPVGLMWLSPDCKDFSKAKGAKPRRDKKVRALAWVAVRWAKAVRPRVIVLENVEEFQDWGPLTKDGKRDPARKGLTFRRFVGRLRALGYAVEWRELRGCDYGAPTTRKRLFLIARRDGHPITWPKPTHGKGTTQPWRTAAECIDWSIPCPSIFLTRREAKAQGFPRIRRPLAQATLRRIARGVRRFVIDAADPFIVTYYGPKRDGDHRTTSIELPLPTQSTENRFGLVVPTLINTRNGEREGQAPRIRDIAQPWSTVTSHGSQGALVSAFLAKHYGGNETPGSTLGAPMDTITVTDHHAVVASHLVKLKGTSRDGQQLTLPLHTVQAGGNHYAEVRAFLIKYHRDGGQHAKLGDPMPTIPTHDSVGLVTVAGEQYRIEDIGMRMLAPRELFRAQGFPDSYRIDIRIKGKPIGKDAQVRMCGNSVCPPLAAAIVRVNLGVEVSEVAA